MCGVGWVVKRFPGRVDWGVRLVWVAAGLRQVFDLEFNLIPAIIRDKSPSLKLPSLED